MVSARAPVVVIVLTSCLVGCGGSGSQGTPPPDPTPKQALKMTVTGSGSVSSSPAGIDCGTTCTASFAPGTTVTLTAAPMKGYDFSDWAGACTGSKTTCTLSITAAMSATATFVAQAPPPPQSYALSVIVTGSGSVGSTPSGINCGATCETSFTQGTSVTLTAAPGTGTNFSSWGGACSGSKTTCTISITAATNVTASFVAQTSANTCAQVSQYGVTFTFDQAYPCGTFANGDSWVTPATAGGHVTITAITPAFTGTQNGFQVNPKDVVNQGFDSDAAHFDASLVPALPYVASAGDSIVKGISLPANSTTGVRLKTAAVLTVLGSIPPDNGATVFRPPYFGTDKPLYSIGTLHFEKLPHLAAIAGTPTIASLTTRYQRVQLDHQYDWDSEWIHPVDNMPTYGSDVAIDNSVAALRLMLDDTAQAKLPLAVVFVQYAIDLAAARRGGLTFSSNGGHRHGRKLLLALAAVMLDDPGMRALVHDAPYDTYQEDGQVYYSAKAGQVLWGQPQTPDGMCTEADYWYNQNNPGHGSAACRDPYGYIDGGDEAGQSYQFCCTVKAFKAIALALRLMPELQCVWNSTDPDNPDSKNLDLLVFADRWVNFGAWAKPDPYKAHGNGVQDGVGRWPQNHGQFKDGGLYDNPFADALWTAYRASAPPTATCN